MITLCYCYLLVLFYALLTEKIYNCEPIYNPNYGSDIRKWYNFPEKGSYIFQDIPMKTNNFDDSPQCPNGASYCEKETLNYPYHILNKVLNANNFTKMSSTYKYSLNNFRDIDDSDENTVCESIREIIRPMVASNRMGKRKFILNQEEGEEFVQEIHVEKCKPGVSLQNRCGSYSLVGNRKTGCKVKYLAWRLISFSVDGEVSVDSFLFPSACSCMYI